MKDPSAAPPPDRRTRKFIARATRTLTKNERGLYKRKRQAIIDAGVGGRVLDFGAGFGITLQYLALPELAERVTDVLCLEPNVYWDGPLRAFHRDHAPTLSMTPFYGFLDEYLAENADAEGTFDAVICSQVLCSVGDDAQIRAQLALIRRALRPGGVLVFSEHVAADGVFRAGVQALIGPLWTRCADGCCLRRRTGGIIASLDWAHIELDRWWYKQAGPAWPQVIGYARM